MKLSVLDQSAAASGRSEAEAVRETLDLAQLCERLGYHRYWVSEHHNLGAIVGTAPEVLLGAIAATTRRMRIGSAGILLPHYSALKVAEQFRVLDALAPNRVDLGVGRAPGGDQRTASALNPWRAGRADDFPDQVRDLAAWIEAPPGVAHDGIVAHPQDISAPTLWLLGSSDYGARLAAQLGVPYAYAYFFSDGAGAEEALALYRRLYRPSERHPTPQATLCVWALAAETDDAARHEALGRERWRLDRQRGVFGALQSPEVLAARGYTASERPAIEAMRRSAFVGSAQTVAERLRRIASQFDVDELVVNTWAHSHAARCASYTLLADAFQLGGTA